MVVVVGASDVVDGGVPVSGSLDDGGLVDGAWVPVSFDGPGLWLDVAGAGVVGALPEV